MVKWYNYLGYLIAKPIMRRTDLKDNNEFYYNFSKKLGLKYRIRICQRPKFGKKIEKYISSKCWNLNRKKERLGIIAIREDCSFGELEHKIQKIGKEINLKNKYFLMDLDILIFSLSEFGKAKYLVSYHSHPIGVNTLSEGDIVCSLIDYNDKKKFLPEIDKLFIVLYCQPTDLRGEEFWWHEIVKI